MSRAASALLSDLDAVSSIFVRSDPNGVTSDGTSLFVADARDGSILRIDDSQSRRVAQIDSGGVVAAHRLGGIAVGPDGALYVARLGHGRAGAIFRIAPDGACEPLAGLSPRYWRLGVFCRGDALYTTQFLKSHSGPFEGSVVRVDLVSGAIETACEGLLKPVGVVELGDQLVITDSRVRAVFVSRRGVARVLADGLDRPDSLCIYDHESVLVTTYDEGLRRGQVFRVWLDGRRKVVASGPWEPRGIAHDGTHAYVAARRLGRLVVVRI
jgi:DNA-binding beta-propeller fold protein YncE